MVIFLVFGFVEATTTREKLLKIERDREPAKTVELRFGSLVLL